MDKDQLIQRLMATFLGELDVHVGALDRDLLALEQAQPHALGEILTTLFRTVHSLKGAARSVDLGLVETTAHRLETIFGGIRDGWMTLEPALVQVLFAAADALKDASARLRGKQDLAAGPLATVAVQLDATIGAGAPIARSAAPAAPLRPRLPATAHDGPLRVSASKLDAMLARSSELLIARRRADARHDEIHELQDTLRLASAEWRRVKKTLRPLLAANANHGTGVAALGRTAEILEQLARRVEVLAFRMNADRHELDQVATRLDGEVRRVRMLPFGEACEGLERMVRDLAHACDKEVELVVEGQEVELDRSILEAVRDPLIHLVRNAVDHGIEPPEQRRNKGKPARARVVVTAALRGSGVEVVVADDGAGLDLAKIRDQARERFMTVPEDPRELARLILLPGFTTAPRITEVSGRGIGLDVVNHRVEQLHGTVEVSFEPDRGARFALTLPLTLTTLRALLVGCAGQIFALPSSQLRRLARSHRADLGSIEGREVLLGSGAPVPVVALAELLGLEAPRSAAAIPLVVVGASEQLVAIAVDELLAEQDIVVLNLGARIRHVRNFAGATLLPTGRIALILNVSELVQRAFDSRPGRALATAFDAPLAARRRLLVIDDSITTRSLVKSILEAAGYEVVAAADGEEGWRLLQDRGADLVVSDVEMPRMDGFALTEAIRSSRRFRDLPIVLVTALETEADKARGLAAGASAYLPKSGFDQRNLLQTIAQLV